jgi:hypothetical protein
MVGGGGAVAALPDLLSVPPAGQAVTRMVSRQAPGAEDLEKTSGMTLPQMETIRDNLAEVPRVFPSGWEGEVGLEAEGPPDP